MIAKEHLNKIKAAPNAVDSFKATLDALEQDQTIPQGTAGRVGLALEHHRDELETAINARPKK